MPESTSSPAKGRDPVAASRKWMLLALCSGAVLLGCAGLYIYFTNFSTDLFIRFVLLAVAFYFLVLTLFRAFQAAAQCRHQRNFDTLAVALRPQRAAWMVLAALLGFFAATLPIFAYLNKHNAAGLDRHLELYKAEAAARKAHGKRL